MFGIFAKVRRVGVIAALVGGLAFSGSANALELIQNSANATATLNTLMQPIQPFLTGAAQTTSSITQIGRNNFASSNVTGASNLSVIDQGGSRNRAIQAIEGSNSAQLLVQGGTNNSVVQASIGDRNFQLVGVSGNNNSVAYVQVGNDLAGALDVTNAQNATVLALQTPQSGRYLMPTGIRGLQNAVVIIGPGRMYVFPTRRR